MFHKLLSIVGGVALVLMLGRAWHFRAWRMAEGSHGTYRRRPFAHIVGHWHRDWDDASDMPAEPGTAERKAPANDAASAE
jgi:hypothetical protein